MNSPRVAIIADDLTGALDVCAPFARRGLRCEVAVTPKGLPETLSSGADVICVNTASRELAPANAMTIVEKVATQLAAINPDIAFQKVDSRFKGHVIPGIDILTQSFGRSRAVVSPAVPAQGRFVRDGRIVGAGVPEPIDLITRFTGRDDVTVADGSSEADMARLARENMHDALLIGASGLGAGLAQVLAASEPQGLLHAHSPILFAIGSHDPATLRQIEQLAQMPGVALIETADGAIDKDLPSQAVTLARAISDPASPGHAASLARFGRNIADQLRGGHFASVLLCGGETAQSVLDALDIQSLTLLGEALPGVPLSQARLGGKPLTILTKSGGFGTPDDLCYIAQAARPVPLFDSISAGIPA